MQIGIIHVSYVWMLCAKMENKKGPQGHILPVQSRRTFHEIISHKRLGDFFRIIKSLYFMKNI